ncbi:DUF1292 domain-containing protein [Oceanobacillus profundus]|uniref:DUF1292 domain-containing protein n=1 Tax=Oceanobacillus profundus TaxID=372463 RepID=A0A417YBA6_9BACI|nr:DUF1292 domain-containing protein [Oceanobacillus profundus]MBR3119032.1 DUF1292 domain-containing protein [Oceanobacillus sp.]PAE30782.1 DUF1292 domain-containing protein [Paenibacillus sp. 7884-2]MCM3398328.1 DUF1292 domain-containing protein [Oceanobacillus profundus]MDO6451854.1 DUF1292 domain-containing protein [Oceanobacillus profundus]RHW29797.1 DUF1292 domain-containing protein [Oceanobacillus profundus]
MDKIEVGEVFTISDETDVDQEVEVLAKVTLENIDYVAVSFLEDLQEDSDEDIDIFFLKIDDDGELSAIESDEEFDKVSEAFDQILEED